MRIDPPAPFESGDRIELTETMKHDPNPIEVGAKGTVERCYWAVDRWQVAVTWDNGRTLNLVMPPDNARKIAE